MTMMCLSCTLSHFKIVISGRDVRVEKSKNENDCKFLEIRLKNRQLEFYNYYILFFFFFFFFGVSWARDKNFSPIGTMLNS